MKSKTVRVGLNYGRNAGKTVPFKMIYGSVTISRVKPQSNLLLKPPADFGPQWGFGLVDFMKALQTSYTRAIYQQLFSPSPFWNSIVKRSSP